jgi:hypothetical protein
MSSSSLLRKSHIAVVQSYGISVCTALKKRSQNVGPVHAIVGTTAL